MHRNGAGEKKVNKKGVMTLGQGPTLILTVVLVAAIGVAAFLVINGLGSATTDVQATNAIDNISLGLEDFYGYMPTILTIAAVSILLGLIVVGFAFGRSRGMV